MSENLRRYRVSTRRSAELVLLIGAWLIGVFAWILVDGATGAGALAGWTTLVSSGLLLLFAHTVVRTQAPYADPILLPVAALLNMLGLAMIHRLDVAGEQRALANGSPKPTPDVYAQITWMALGLIFFMITLTIIRDHRRLQRRTFIFGAAGIVLLFLPIIPGLGSEVNGARLWIKIGTLTFQPGELAKIALTIFFAGYLVSRRHTLALIKNRVGGLQIPRAKDAGPLILIWISCLHNSVKPENIPVSGTIYFKK